MLIHSLYVCSETDKSKLSVKCLDGFEFWDQLLGDTCQCLSSGGIFASRLAGLYILL